MNSVDVTVPDIRRSTRRFAVSWRNRVRRSIDHVAVLDYNVEGGSGAYVFRYLKGVGSEIGGFRPFIGFPTLDRTYTSSRLWPFFDLRVMDRKRPDYEQYLRWLGLPLNADRLDVLGRSGGELKGDTVSLAESPPVSDDGATRSTFLVRGCSYAVRLFGSASIVDQIQGLDRLGIVEDTGNEANPAALLLTAPDGAPVGWVPDLLVGYARRLMESGNDSYSVTVIQNNGPEAPWHMRLLVTLAGHGDPTTPAFTGGVWPPFDAGS